MWAKKSLGQNFLRSEGAINDIVAAGELSEKDTVLEVGPGEGVLTRALLNTGTRVIAVEKDDRLIAHLNYEFKQEVREGRFTLIHGDILLLPREALLLPHSWKLIANIPYYITGALVSKFLDEQEKPERMVLMMQEEVALRTLAKDKKESILSVAVKTYGVPRIVRKVPRGSFTPVPTVDSAVLAIESIRDPFITPAEQKLFFDVLHAGFGHKRKLLARNLEIVAKKEDIERAFVALGLGTHTRAEDITPPAWLSLARNLSLKQ